VSYRGIFTPKNTSKYLGNAKNVVYRSLWELRMFKYCDTTPAIVGWASEEFCIPYVSPVDGRVHRYFPDLALHVKQSDQTIKKFVLEIKPAKQTHPPIAPKRQTSRYLKEVMTYAINDAKWVAAKAFCEQHGMSFKVITEAEIFGKGVL
jgi:hypothetical protein